MSQILLIIVALTSHPSVLPRQFLALTNEKTALGHALWIMILFVDAIARRIPILVLWGELGLLLGLMGNVKTNPVVITKYQNIKLNANYD